MSYTQNASLRNALLSQANQGTAQHGKQSTVKHLLACGQPQVQPY